MASHRFKQINEGIQKDFYRSITQTKLTGLQCNIHSPLKLFSDLSLTSSLVLGESCQHTVRHRQVSCTVGTFPRAPGRDWPLTDCLLINTISILSYSKLNCSHAKGSRGGVGFSPAFVCLSVFLHYVSKTDAARIIKFDIQMFHVGSWKYIYFGVKRWRSQGTKNNASTGFCTLLTAGFYWF